VAVVIPTRNRWPLLRTALAGALAQRGVNVHVIVVDDGSSDGTSALLAAFDEPRLTVLRHDEGQGVAAARNRGLAEVSAPWVAFLDDDDVWAPGHLAAMLDAVDAAAADRRRIGLVYSGHVEVDWARRVIGISRAAPVAGVPEHLDRFNLIGGPSRVLLRTDAVRGAGGFDPAFSTVADWDLWVRVAAEWELAACEELLVGYMRHPESMSFDADRLLAEIVAMREKHGWQPAGPSGPWPGDTLAFHVAVTYRAAGRRFSAARWYVRSYLARRDLRDLARAVGVVLGERAIRRSGLGLRERLEPDLGAWLEDVRQAEDESSDELPAPVRPGRRRILVG
jgi:glycosyltransferase involved in cell wall biosynthesis